MIPIPLLQVFVLYELGVFLEQFHAEWVPDHTAMPIENVPECLLRPYEEELSLVYHAHFNIYCY
jgi:hypothetical protein